MKYNTIGTTREEKMKKASFTIYADMELSQKKMANTEVEISTIRGELEIVQKALKLQSKRCRQLVTEYTKRLQQKEQQYQSEKTLRDDQLSKVLRALIIFEARLKQEQKFISHQLKEKDYIIKKQCNEIKKLLENQYCKNCNQYYDNNPNLLESLDSTTDYQSSTFESLDSSSDIYGTISEKSDREDTKFIKNNNKINSLRRKNKKIQHKKSVGSYFEVLKIRNEALSPCSNTSNDYDNLDSLPTETITNKINEVSERIENILSDSEKPEKSKISDSIPVFEGGNDTNDNWYASASDQEDDQQRDIYRNNPVLECMNQILLQNINDSLNSPPKTPNLERKSTKKVKFSDEETNCQLTKENLEDGGYYETPVQKTPNFYETPQSIYSNDYEQIISKCNESFTPPPKKNHVYVDLEPQEKKRTPPALPPKPANLILKYKSQKVDLESEPDYCSISELNLPTGKATSKKISVVAEINSPNSQDVIKATAKANEYDPVSPPNLIVKKCVEKLNIQLAKQTSIVPSPPKKPDPEIPKLPQVSEILIPEEVEEEKEERISHDNYVKNNSQILKMKNKRPIVMGTSVSNLISGFNNQLISEISKKPPVFTNFDNDQNLEKTATFDLSQNFEEFKLDDCEIEEYSVSDIPEEEELIQQEDKNLTRVELIRATDPVPSLNSNSVEQLKKQLELQKNKVAQENQPTYEHFLECTGLSSKAILTPSRLISNHKSMLKPKDIKLRSKVNKANLFDRHSTSTIKYWSEPYI